MLNTASLSYLGGHLRDALRRFPYVLLAAAASAVLAILMIEYDVDDVALVKVFLTCALGIPLFFALALYREKPLPAFRPPAPLLLCAGLLSLSAFYLLGRGAPDREFFLRCAQWSAAAHLLCAFAPFMGRGESNGFWQYNRALFLRFCLSALYAAVFFLGLALALRAVDFLLGVKVRETIYPQLWVFSTFVFMTWHFLAGTPAPLSALEGVRDYPRGLKVFTQYLLIPLVTLYVVILYLYMGKILVQGVWPKGIITWMVSALSVFGVFTLLLVHPVRDRRENRWIGVYARGFYVALFPLLLMLFVAAGKRIAQYGVTEQRYLVVVLALWISGIALYFLFNRKGSIKIVPVSLFAVALLTSFGPWGAYAVSERWQWGRLKAILVRNGLWEDGKAGKVADPDGKMETTSSVSWEDRKEVSAIVRYLIQNHGVESLEGRFDLDPARYKGKGVAGAFGAEQDACRSLGFDAVSAWATKENRSLSYARPDLPGVFAVEGYNLLVYINAHKRDAFAWSGRAYKSRVTGETLEIVDDGRPVLRLDLGPLIEKLEKEGSLVVNHAPEAMVVEGKGPRFSAKFYVTHLRAERRDGRTHNLNCGGPLLLKPVKGRGK